MTPALAFKTYNITIPSSERIRFTLIPLVPASTTNIGNSILIMENLDSRGYETLETPNIFLFPSVLSILLL